MSFLSIPDDDTPLVTYPGPLIASPITIDGINNAKNISANNSRPEIERKVDSMAKISGRGLSGPQRLKPAPLDLPANREARAADRYNRWFGNYSKFAAYEKTYDAVARTEKLKPKYEYFGNLATKIDGAKVNEDGNGLANKRGSKAGLMAATLPGSTHHIHFELSGLDVEGVVNKTREKNNQASITGSELRLAYRLRAQLGDRVHFYHEGKEVAAPWVQNPQLWATYRPKSQTTKEDDEPEGGT
ncbi:hypothetical protein [Paraburkholderia humisilvae]